MSTRASCTRYKPTFAGAWAVCRDDWLMVASVSALRAEAINKFMTMAEGPNWSDKQWRYWKRRGYRASHVGITEYLFKP